MQQWYSSVLGIKYSCSVVYVPNRYHKYPISGYIGYVRIYIGYFLVPTQRIKKVNFAAPVAKEAIIFFLPKFQDMILVVV